MGIKCTFILFPFRLIRMSCARVIVMMVRRGESVCYRTRTQSRESSVGVHDSSRARKGGPLVVPPLDRGPQNPTPKFVMAENLLTVAC